MKTSESTTTEAELPSVRSEPLLGPNHTGMRVSCSGLLGRIASGGRCAKVERYMLGELLKHLEQVGREYYAGNVKIVDEFLQCYCLDDHRPNMAFNATSQNSSPDNKHERKNQ